MTTTPDRQRDTRPGNQKKPAALAALLAAADVVLAVLANKFFESAAWVAVVIVAGAIFVLLNIFNVRAENGDRILLWSHIRTIVAGRIFIAFAAALLAAGLTFAIMHYADRANAGPQSDPSRSPGAPPTPGPVASASAPPSTPATCDRAVGQPGVVPVQKQVGAPPGLTFCPALLNNGKPLPARSPPPDRSSARPTSTGT